MKRYNIFFEKYNMFINCYIPFCYTVETDDIYHEVGRLICNSLEALKNVRYCEVTADKERYERAWADAGYKRVLDTDFWCKMRR